MFSGIIQSTGTITMISRGQTGRIEVDSSAFDPNAGTIAPGLGAPVVGAPVVGESIAVNGVCLTVVSIGGSKAQFDLASETVRQTTLADLESGTVVNLERALRVGDRLDGHLVQGHVDAVTEVLSVEQEDQTKKIRFKTIESIRELIAPKGSVAVDGVSLTVGPVDAGSFSVYLVPHTEKVTTLGRCRPGSVVNIEADCLARYVAWSAAVTNGRR